MSQRNRLLALALAFVAATALPGCASSEPGAGSAGAGAAESATQKTEGRSTPPESVDITSDNLREVSAQLRAAGAANVATFDEWVRAAESGAGAQADASTGFADADCRMTAMLLGAEAITVERPEAGYDGTYLMFDLDAIDNQAGYGALKERRAEFTTLFGEMPIADGDLATALPANWANHGIGLAQPKLKLVSLVMQTAQGEEAFVGHTGILLERGEGQPKLFVEKIAFGEPFKATEIAEEADLLTLFASRPDYTPGQGEPAPLVYLNDRLLGDLGLQ